MEFHWDHIAALPPEERHAAMRKVIETQQAAETPEVVAIQDDLNRILSTAIETHEAVEALKDSK